MGDANLFSFDFVHHVALLLEEVLPLLRVWSFRRGKLGIPNLVPLASKSCSREPHPVTLGSFVGPAMQQENLFHRGRVFEIFNSFLNSLT
jgi:hypothetical protein